jgi:hypothetical protein
MPTLPANSGHGTLVDIASALDPDGKIATVAELLNQSNEIIQDVNFFAGNLPTGHKTSVRTGLPSVIMRKFYQGTPVSKSLRATVTDTIGMAESRMEIDRDLAELGGNAADYRASESFAYVEAMSQKFGQQVFYGDNTADPDGILGLSPRFSSLSAQTGTNVMSAGGAGSDNTSVWLIVWGDNTISGIYPKGSKAGLIHEDQGIQPCYDSSNNVYDGYRDKWQWKFGLCVKDWRYAVRIANIDISDLRGFTGTQVDTASTYLPYLMAESLSKIPSMSMGRACFYANRTVKGMMAVQGVKRLGGFLTVEQAANQFGKLGPGSVAGTGTGISGGSVTFLGVPVRTVDQLLLTEAVVS